MRIAVVEDNKDWADRIQELIWQRWNIESEYYADAEEFLNEKIQYQVVFVDIKLPHMDGLQATEFYKKYYKDSCIFLVTGYIEYSIDGCWSGANGFVDKANLEAYMDKAFRYVEKYREQEERKNRSLEFEIIGQGKRLLKIDDILCFYAENRTIIIKTATMQYRTEETLKKLGERLKKEGFSFAHKSYLLNICHIKKIVRETGRKRDKIIILSDGTSIPLSRNRIEEIEDLFWKWKNELTKG